MAQAKATRVSIEAELLSSQIFGGISLSPGKKLRYLYNFRGSDGAYYRVESSKALHTERVKLSGEISGVICVGCSADGRMTYMLSRPVIKEVR